MKTLLTAIILTICMAGVGQTKEVFTAIDLDHKDSVILQLNGLKSYAEKHLFILEAYIEHCKQDSIWIEGWRFVEDPNGPKRPGRPAGWDTFYQEKVQAITPTFEGYYEWLKNLLE